MYVCMYVCVYVCVYVDVVKHDLSFLLPALEATQAELIELKNKFDAEAAAR